MIDARSESPWNDGSPVPLTGADIHTAEITTRDIDRAGFRHFLLKEISEAPRSFRKTLRGRIESNVLQVEFGSQAG